MVIQHSLWLESKKLWISFSSPFATLPGRRKWQTMKASGSCCLRVWIQLASSADLPLPASPVTNTARSSPIINNISMSRQLNKKLRLSNSFIYLSDGKADGKYSNVSQTEILNIFKSLQKKFLTFLVISHIWLNSLTVQQLLCINCLYNWSIFKNYKYYITSPSEIVS